MQQETQEEGKGCATGPLGEGGRQEHLAGIATGTRGGGGQQGGAQHESRLAKGRIERRRAIGTLAQRGAEKRNTGGGGTSGILYLEKERLQQR